MNTILWGIFYLITSLILLYFFIREKQVVGFIRKKEDEILKKISVGDEAEKKRVRLGNVITIIGIITAGVFFFIVDRTPDPVIRLKIWGIYGMFILNLLFLIIRREHEWIFLANLVMLFLGKLMFNILDTNFYIYLFITMVLSVPLIFLYRKPAKNRITESTVRNESKDGEFSREVERIRKETGKDAEEARKELVEIEKRSQSTLGKAFARMDTAITAVVLVLLIQTFYLGNYVIPTGSMEPTIKVQDRVFANMIKYRFTLPKVGDIVAFKEPITDKIMYTKRVVGAAGQTMQIKIDKSLDVEINGRASQRKLGKIYLNDKIEDSLSVREYSAEGILGDSKIYIPKKGDKVKLDKLIELGEDGTFRTLTSEEFLSQINTKSNFKEIIGNENYGTYYTFILKAEGRDELLLPILDFKYNDELFMKLLNGETFTLDQNYYVTMGDNTLNSLDSRYFGYTAENRIKGNLLFRWWPLNRLGLL
ncbi:MAG: signal peptidase I [Leptotrichiaceae bacterium]|nr:signal peptidase I [Leptotrichiaceae bacterium]